MPGKGRRDGRRLGEKARVHASSHNVTRVQEGGFYGWPWYYIGNFEDRPHAGERPDLAGKAIVPDVLEQAHSASLQMTFYTATNGPAAFPPEYRGDAFVALHGSWNRATRIGYKLVRIPLTNGVSSGRYERMQLSMVRCQPRRTRRRHALHFCATSITFLPERVTYI